MQTAGRGQPRSGWRRGGQGGRAAGKLNRGPRGAGGRVWGGEAAELIWVTGVRGSS